MLKEDVQNKHQILSAIVIMCGLLYIFAYQFEMPFKAEVLLYAMVFGLVAMTIFDGHIIVTKQVVLFVLIAISAFSGVMYSIREAEGMREAILFTLYAGLFITSLTNPHFVKSFTVCIFWVSVIVVLSSIIHCMAPDWFNDIMKMVLKKNAYEQLMDSYNIDNTFAGISAYTPNTTFSAAIVFGTSFLNITNKREKPIINSKIINVIFLSLSLFSIIICSKRGIFIATLVATIVLMFYLYRGKDFILRFFLVAFILTMVLMILYEVSEFAYTFLNRFISNDFLTGRDVIYESLLLDFEESNVLIGRGTAATYEIAEKGAHNIYLQLLYDHGIVFALPYYIFFVYNYYVAFKNKCPISIFVQTLFLVYGMSGNPLYSNMLMLIYIYYVLYAARMPDFEKQNVEKV